jgi:hypothetical protein
MMKRIIASAVIAVAVFLSGCAAPRYMENAMETARERAFFDMECDDVSGRLLGHVIPFGEYVEMVIGVTGCDKRASYLILCKSAGVGEDYRCTSLMSNKHGQWVAELREGLLRKERMQKEEEQKQREEKQKQQAEEEQRQREEQHRQFLKEVHGL